MSETDRGPYQVFQVEPFEIESGKAAVSLARTDIISASMMVVARGGENNLHAHSASEEIWLVIKGEAAFYGEGNREIARLGPLGGVLIPRGAPYWFESSGPEPLVILRLGATKEGVEARRIDYTPQPDTIRKLRELRKQSEAPAHVPAS